MRKWNLRKKRAAILLSVALTTGLCFSGGDSFANVQGVQRSITQEKKSAESIGIYVDTPTQEEIRTRAAKIQELLPAYAEAPKTTAPYSAGSLSRETLSNAIDVFNFVRFIAGVPDDVTLNTEYSRKAQAASLVNFVNDQISHAPAKPSDMEDSLYQLGKEGAGSSNLGCGWGSGSFYANGRSFYDAIIHGWMNDGDASNIDRVGHRRWVINPSMKQTGFGQVWGKKGSMNSFQDAMYAFDNSFGATEYYGVAWPAQNMPIEMFKKSYPWSISMGETVSSDIVVTLTRKGDGKTWTFKKGSKDFYIENSYYGQKGCIIFKPSDIDGYHEGDSFDVSISGGGLTVQYTVNFFALNGSVAVTATPRPTATLFVTAEPTATPRVTATPTATPFATAEPTATATPRATLRPTVTPFATAEPTATATPRATSRPTATPRPTVTPFATAEPTATPRVTPRPTAIPFVTAEPVATPRVTPRPTATTPVTIEVPTATPVRSEFYVNTPTQEEIRTRAAKVGDIVPIYAEKPKTTAPYSAGSLSKATLKNAIDVFNLVRFIAGIPDDVTLNTEYNKKAQAAALVNYVNGTISHFPVKPADMDDSLYELGRTGAGSSNLGCGWGYLNGESFFQEIIHGWMYDGDSSNIDRVGHRRWILNPGMGQTGFGEVWGLGEFQTAMYAFDGSFKQTDYSMVAWPARNMPVSFFGKNYPWSISVGKAVSKDTSVTLTRKRDGKTWTFRNGTKDFYINNDNYGQTGCIIFRPSGVDGYQAGDVFDVSISGKNIDFKYSVNFFSLSGKTADEQAVVKLKKVTIRTAKNQKGKKIKLSWGKVANATGYQIQYAQNRKFTSARKSKTTGKTTFTLTGLKKKTYYIRIRAYKKEGSSKVYGAWSTVKKVTVRK